MIPPVSPCGLVVERMRSAYTTRVRFYADTDADTEVTWYRVPDGTPCLPLATLFGSANWEQPNGPRSGMAFGYVGQGEQLSADRPWRNGSAPFGPGTPPGHFCGTPEQWLGDLVLSRDGTAPVDGAGRPLCCGFVPPPPADPCPNCSGSSRASYLVTCAVPISAAHAVARLGGLQRVDRVTGFPCLWRGPLNVPTPAIQWQISVSAGSLLDVGYRRGATLNALASNIPWDCASPITVPLTSDPAKGTFPPSLLLEPLA